MSRQEASQMRPARRHSRAQSSAERWPSTAPIRAVNVSWSEQESSVVPSAKT
jgi:hypothetical protein